VDLHPAHVRSLSLQHRLQFHHTQPNPAKRSLIVRGPVLDVLEYAVPALACFDVHTTALGGCIGVDLGDVTVHLVAAQCRAERLVRRRLNAAWCSVSKTCLRGGEVQEATHICSWSPKFMHTVLYTVNFASMVGSLWTTASILSLWSNCKPVNFVSSTAWRSPR
jgi:hypothetical protein